MPSGLDLLSHFRRSQLSRCGASPSRIPLSTTPHPSQSFLSSPVHTQNNYETPKCPEKHFPSMFAPPQTVFNFIIWRFVVLTMQELPFKKKKKKFSTLYSLEVCAKTKTFNCSTHATGHVETITHLKAADLILDLTWSATDTKLSPLKNRNNFCLPVLKASITGKFN